MDNSVASGGVASGTAMVVWEPVAASAGPFGSAPVMDAVPRPVKPVKPAQLARAVRIGKAALMIWGAVSLTAAGAYAIGKVFSGGPVLQAESALVPKPAERELAAAPVPVASQPARVAAVSSDAAGGYKPAATEPKKAAAQPPTPRKVESAPRKVEAAPAPAQADPVGKPTTATAALAAPQIEAPRKLLPITNADDAEIASVKPAPGIVAEPDFAGEEPEPQELAAARVPRPRPDAPAPIVTGSIDREWDDVRRQRRWDRRFEAWREREFRRIRRLPRYIIVR